MCAARARHERPRAWQAVGDAALTPVLEQQAAKTKSALVGPVVASSIEAFYRSALQGFLIPQASQEIRENRLQTIQSVSEKSFFPVFYYSDLGQKSKKNFIL